MPPMGPMGPMMGEPWGGGALVWLAIVLTALVILAFGAVVGFARLDRGAAAERRPQVPEALLRERYARGELTRQQYREALVDVLKDRYVRGEIELDDYEARLGHLVSEPSARAPEAAGSGERPERPSTASSREVERG